MRAVTELKVGREIGEKKFDELLKELKALGCIIEDCGEEENRTWGNVFFATISQTANNEEFFIKESEYTDILKKYANEYNDNNPEYEWEVEYMADTEIFA